MIIKVKHPIHERILSKTKHYILPYRSQAQVLTIFMLCTALFSACSFTKSAELSQKKPHIIATTPAWAAVANAITGAIIPVKSIINRSTDPHDYELSAADMLQLNQADLIIANGGGYDDNLLRGIENQSHIINAFTLVHKPAEANMHVFLDLPTVIQVAQKLTDTLDQYDPAHSTSFNYNMQKFQQALHARIHHLATMHQKHRPSSVIQTETVGTYFLEIAHILDKSPLNLKEDKELSMADIDQITGFLKRKEVSALIINQGAQIINQGAQNSRTDNFKYIAEISGVPVINFSESPTQHEDYVDWLDSMIAPLVLAVRD